jgi:hypothetical protein
VFGVSLVLNPTESSDIQTSQETSFISLLASRETSRTMTSAHHSRTLFIFAWLLTLCTLVSSRTAAEDSKCIPASYFDNSGYPDALSGGVQMVPIKTRLPALFTYGPNGIGNNPRVKVLLLHGGPGTTHEYLESIRQLLSWRGNSVLLLRSTRFLLQRPAKG